MILAKDKLNDWLAGLEEYTLYAPTENNGIIQFSSVNNPDRIVLEHNSILSPKGILFPQTEPLFFFTAGKKMEIRAPVMDDKKKIIFGIRPCDAKSVSTLDHVFNGEYKDEMYLQNKGNTILIGLACTRPEMNCFCTSLDCGPGSRNDVDILFTDLGDRYHVDVVTEKGRGLIDEHQGLFTLVTEDDVKKVIETHNHAEELIMRCIDVNDIPEKLGKIFESDLWKKIAMKCLGCGICTYLCPTCHCFDIQDEAKGVNGRRARMWDSCMYPEYTLHTSGHNPRPTRMNRIRNRVYHKFKYYPDNHDAYLCSGCGRCVNECPVNIDIIEIISMVRGEQND